MKLMEKWNVRGIVTGLLAGFLIGGVIEGAAALAGGIRGGMADALLWAQVAGIVVGIIGVCLLLRDTSGRRAFLRPGRSALEMEYEVQDENRYYEKAMREAGGEAHRMPRWGSVSRTAVDIGILLAALTPMCISLPR